MSHKLAIVGGTGAVGRVFIDYLNNHKLDLEEIRIVASKRSAGKIIKLENSEIKVEDIEGFNFSSVDFAFFSAGSVLSTIDSYGSAENGVGPTWLVDGSTLFADEGPADMASQVAALIDEVAEVRAKIISGEIVVTDVTAGG